MFDIKNYCVSFPIIENQCLNLFKSENYDELLKKIQTTVLENFRTDALHNKALYVEKFDEILSKLGRKLQSNINNEKKNASNNLNLIIGTEFYSIGGHTRVAQDFSKIESNTLVVITDLYDRLMRDVRYFRTFQDLFPNNPVILLPPGNLLEKIIFLKKILICLNPKSVMLLTHHDDPIGVTALCGSAIDKKIFYHHCDHNISLGATVQEFEHYDTTPGGKEICSQKLNSKYLPLSYENKNNNDFIYYENELLNTVTSATAIKYNFEIIESADFYPKIISYILQLTGGCHYHIGSLSDVQLDNIKNYLDKCEINREKFIYVGQVESLENFVCKVKNPIYLCSFPTPGLLSWLEILSTGTPILAYTDENQYRTQNLITSGCFDSLLPPWTMKFDDYVSLNNNFDYVRNNYEKIKILNKLYFEKFHSKKVTSPLMKDVIV